MLSFAGMVSPQITRITPIFYFTIQFKSEGPRNTHPRNTQRFLTTDYMDNTEELFPDNPK